MKPGRQSIVLVGVALIATWLSGCGDGDQIGKTVPVSGKVLLDGKPVNSGMVNFNPVEEKGNKMKGLGMSPVNNGQYSLRATSATGEKPGVGIGWYKVTVQSAMPPSGTVAAPAKDTTKAPSAMPASGGLPSKYANPQTSPLFIEVKEGTSEYDLQLSSR